MGTAVTAPARHAGFAALAISAGWICASGCGTRSPLLSPDDAGPGNAPDSNSGGPPQVDAGDDPSATGTCPVGDAPPAPANGPIELASPDQSVNWVGVLGGQVYYSVYGGAIYGVSSAGGSAPSIVASPVSDPPYGYIGFYEPNVFAFDSTYVYWAEQAGDPDGWLKRAPLCGGAMQVIASPDTFIAGVVVDSGNVYWVDQNNGAIFRSPVTGGAATTVASGLALPAGLALQAGILYLTDAGGDLLSVPTSGGVVTTMLQGPGYPYKSGTLFYSPCLAVDDANVYFAYALPSPALVKVPRNGGPPTTLTPGSALTMAVDANNLYWVDFTGSIDEVPIVGGAIKVLVANQNITAGPALDEHSVYWGTSEIDPSSLCPPSTNLGNNSVMKIGK